MTISLSILPHAFEQQQKKINTYTFRTFYIVSNSLDFSKRSNNQK